MPDDRLEISTPAGSQSRRPFKRMGPRLVWFAVLTAVFAGILELPVITGGEWAGLSAFLYLVLPAAMAFFALSQSPRGPLTVVCCTLIAVTGGLAMAAYLQVFSPQSWMMMGIFLYSILGGTGAIPGFTVGLIAGLNRREQLERNETRKNARFAFSYPTMVLVSLGLAMPIVIAGELLGFDVRGGLQPRVRFRVSELTTGCAFATDPIQLVTAFEGGTIQFWDLDSRSVSHRLTVNGTIRSIDVSPDGKELALGMQNGTLLLVDRWTGNETRRTDEAEGQGEIDLVEYSRDGNLLVWHLHDNVTTANTVFAWRRAEPEPKVFLSFDRDEGWVADMTLSSNGNWFVYAGKEIQVLGTDTRVQVRSHREHTLILRAVAISESADVLASGDGRGDTPAKIILWSTSQREVLHELDAHGGCVSGLEFACDSEVLLSSTFADGNVYEWDVATGGMNRVLKGLRYPVELLTVSPDGQKVAAVDAGGNVCNWDLR